MADDLGVKALSVRLDLFERRLGEQLRQAVNEALELVADDARETAAFADRSGTLRDSIHTVVEEDPRDPLRVVGKVVASAKHAPWIEFGTGPRGKETNTNPAFKGPYSPEMVLNPAQGKALHWVDESGRNVFASSILWKGMPARPFLYPAFEKNKAQVRKLMRSAVARVVFDRG
jgi:HK97 gp10 family phage protein